MDMKKSTVISLTCLLSILCALFFCPSVSAEVTEEQNFYHWYVVEKTTEDYVNHHGGGGSGGKKKFNAADALSTDYGCTTEDVIYNCTGLTRQDYLDFVNEQYGDINAENIFSEAFFGTPVTSSNSQLYATSRANRVDSEGNINVSGSDFWRSVYNQMFSGGGYKDVYESGSGDGYTGTSNGMTYDVNVICVNGQIDTSISGFYGDVFDQFYWSAIKDLNNVYSCILVINDNGHTGYINIGSNNYYSYTAEVTKCEINGQFLNIVVTYYRADGDIYPSTTNLKFRYSTSENPNQNQGTPVKQPSQVGFIKYPLGQKTPVYTPDSGEENPFNINDNGTVSMDDDGDPTTDDTDYPVWVNPDELSDDGWKLLFKYVDDDDNSDNPYNPYNRPWNTQEDGTILGGLFNNLIKDISSMISDLASKIKDILNKLINLPKIIADAIAKFLKDFFGDLTEIDLDVDVENHYNLIQEMYETILELMGVEV